MKKNKKTFIIVFLCILAVGMGMNNMPMADAVSKYTVLTIGDGLASQLPSLLMSISCGIVMTRSTSSSPSLGRDLLVQILNKPYALFYAAGFLLLIAGTSFFTGLPGWVFFLLAAGIAVWEPFFSLIAPATSVKKFVKSSVLAI